MSNESTTAPLNKKFGAVIIIKFLIKFLSNYFYHKSPAVFILISGKNII